MCVVHVSKRPNLESFFLMVEFDYSSAKHIAISFSPFMLMDGYQPKSPMTIGIRGIRLNAVRDFLQDMQEMMKIACEFIRVA